MTTVSMTVMVTVALAWVVVLRHERTRVVRDSRRTDRFTERSADLWTAALTVAALVWFATRRATSFGDDTTGIGAAIAFGTVGALAASQTVTDLVTHRLPLRTSHLSAAVIIVAAGFAGLETWLAAVVGAAAMSVIALVVSVVTRGSLGRGDVHFALPLGAAIGVSRGGSVLVEGVVAAWVITAVSAGLVVGALLATRRVSRTTHVPYGPFLALGVLIVIGS